MKKIAILGLGAILLLGGAVLVASWTRNATKVAGDSIVKSLPSGALLLDVRTPDEFAAQHGLGAKNLPLEEIQKGTLPDAAKETQLYVYCRSGNRSKQATSLLKQAGFQKVTDIGGYANLPDYGVPIVSE